MAAMTTASSGLTPEYQTYYDKQLLAHAMPLIVTAQFAQKKPFPKNKGAQTIRFFRPNIADRTRVGSLTEGVAISTFADVVYTPIDVTLAQYGEAIKISDIVSFTDLFSTLDNGVRMMGEDSGVFADFQCVQQVAQNVASANKRYSGGAASYAALKALGGTAGKATILDLLGAYTRLTVTKAKKPEGREYATIVAPQVAYDVMNDQKFVDAGSRGRDSGKGLFNGDIGTWYGNHIYETTEGWSENSTEGTYDGTIVAGGSGSVFSSLVLGREALGAPIMTGQSPFSPSIIVNDKADSGNPLKQYITAGWKAYWATVMLNNTWAVVLRSTSSYA